MLFSLSSGSSTEVSSPLSSSTLSSRSCSSCACPGSSSPRSAASRSSSSSSPSFSGVSSFWDSTAFSADSPTSEISDANTPKPDWNNIAMLNIKTNIFLLFIGTPVSLINTLLGIQRHLPTCYTLLYSRNYVNKRITSETNFQHIRPACGDTGFPLMNLTKFFSHGKENLLLHPADLHLAYAQNFGYLCLGLFLIITQFDQLLLLLGQAVYKLVHYKVV